MEPQADPGGNGIDYEQLNSILWRSRSHLDRLEFVLEVQLLLAKAGRMEWQHQVVELMDSAIEALAVNDLEREVTITELNDPVVLREIAKAAPSPWSVIMADHLVELELAVERLNVLRERTRIAVDDARDDLADLANDIGGR